MAATLVLNNLELKTLIAQQCRGLADALSSGVPINRKEILDTLARMSEVAGNLRLVDVERDI